MRDRHPMSLQGLLSLGVTVLSGAIGRIDVDAVGSAVQLAHVCVPCSICAAENLDQVVTKITVLVPWSLRLFGRNKCPHVHVYGAIVDFQNDVGIVDTGLLRNVFSRNVVANQPVLEDRKSTRLNSSPSCAPSMHDPA